ncbi:MAG: glycosyltransferase, partial [Mariprofundaceae bacterium]|nr:glycosyltransferase [Mariprofundaceae bacterium]
MKDNLTSIITVNFNGGELLTECVRAVLSSTVNLEIIVSDNGSSDGSLTYLEKTIKDPRLKIIRNKQNLGFAAANNIALPHAQ